MRKILALILTLLMALCANALAEPDCAFEGGELTVLLEENPSTGYEWTVEIDDENVAALERDATIPPENLDVDGAPGQRRFVFRAGADGEAVIMLYYERDFEDGEPAQTLCCTATVEDGAFVDCQVEDLTGWGEEEGDDEAVTRYDGETGGVEVMLPADLAERPSEEEGVRLFMSEDETAWVRVEYDPDADAQAMLEEGADEEAVRAAYDDPEAGTEWISSWADPDAEAPYAQVTYSIKDEKEGVTIVDYTCYAAPQGGVTYVENGYYIAF